MYDRDKIINFDFEGWPVCKMNVRDILLAIGLRLNEDTNMLEISNDNEVLDVYPTRLVDDGMGYGVEAQKVTEVSVYDDKDTKRINMFTEDELPNIQIWLEDRVQPGEQIVYNDKEYFVKDLRDYGTNETVNNPNHDPDDDPNYDPNQERFKYELCPDLFNDNIVDNIVITRSELRKAMEKR